MRWIYSAYDPRGRSRDERFRELRSILNLLVTKSGGEVDTALRWLEQLGERHGWFDEGYGFEDFVADLRRDGTVREVRGPDARARMELTGKGERMLREEALERIFTALRAGGPAGEHRTPHAGGSGDDTHETRGYAFGDPLDRIAWQPSLRNAAGRLERTPDGRGFTWNLQERDLEVAEHEHHAGCATVLLVDVSHSMVLYGEDRMLPAREVALALLELVTSRYRRDTLDLVLFGDDAEHVPLHRIPYIQAGRFHTNTKAGLRMAQDILARRRHVNKRVFMITDGKPSALWQDGQLYKNPFGLDEEIVNRTLDEAVSCRRAGIPITTFMVARDPVLVEFVEELTALNRGQAYFTGTEALGATLFVDFLRNRKRRIP